MVSGLSDLCSPRSLFRRAGPTIGRLMGDYVAVVAAELHTWFSGTGCIDWLTREVGGLLVG